jgi:hypothetical protein
MLLCVFLWKVLKFVMPTDFLWACWSNWFWTAYLVCHGYLNVCYCGDGCKDLYTWSCRNPAPDKRQAPKLRTRLSCRSRFPRLSTSSSSFGGELNGMRCDGVSCRSLAGWNASLRVTTLQTEVRTEYLTITPLFLGDTHYFTFFAFYTIRSYLSTGWSTGFRLQACYLLRML